MDLAAFWSYFGAALAVLGAIDRFIWFIQFLDRRGLIDGQSFNAFLAIISPFGRMIRKFFRILWLAFRALGRLLFVGVLGLALTSFALRLSGNEDYIETYTRTVWQKVKPLPSSSADCIRYERRILPPRCEGFDDPIKKLACKIQVPETTDVCVERR